MIFAALGDIHGNWPALERALRAIDKEGIQTIVNTGDSVAGHPWTNEVIECLAERNIPTVQGELDRRVLRFLRKRESLRERCGREEFAVLEDAFGSCTSRNLEYLRSLPRRRVLTLDGVEVALCHGTLASQSESLTADEDDNRYMRQREVLPAPIIVHGKTHIPGSRIVGGTLFVNPGSIGIPNDDDARASFAIVSTEEEPWTVDVRYLDSE